MKKSKLREWMETIVTSFALVLILFTFAMKPFKIPSGSMEDTLKVGDMLFVSRFLYWFQEPARGDIIVFKAPSDGLKVDYIKRVVAVEGETLELKDGKLYINGNPIVEPYIKYSNTFYYEPRQYNFGPVTVPKGYLFVMGDHRNNSKDSRYWGFLDKKFVKGKAFLIYFPITRIRLIS
ncbi:MAG: signal peptidase I [bacterium]|nr:signal peptidase I [bacterium]